MIYLVSGQVRIDDDQILSATVEQCIAYCNSLEYVGVDTETTGFTPYSCKLLSLQLGDFNNQYVIDCSTVDIQLFKELLENKQLIFQNYQFDGRFLYHHRIVPNYVHDTFLAECLINQGLSDSSVSLETIVYKYCKYSLNKSVRGQIHYRGLDTTVIIYAAEDVKYLESAYLQQREILENSGTIEQLRLEEEYVKVLAYIAYSGMKLDRNAWKAKCIKGEEDLLLAKKALDDWALSTGRADLMDMQYDMFNEGFKVKVNWNSSKQVIPIFKGLGFNLLVKDKVTGKMKYSVEDNVISQQAHLHPLASLYLNYKGLQKEVSTYGENWFKLIDPVSERIHTSFWQIRDTGRLSSGDKDNKVPNFQNIPADKVTRECFIPEEGNVFVDCDYDSMEVRVFTNLSKEQNLIDFFKLKGANDMHCQTARALFPELKDLSDDEIKAKHKDKRQTGKIASFTMQFSGNGFTLSKNLGVSKEQGELIYNTYMKAYPGIEKYFKISRAEALSRGYILISDKTGAKCYVDGWNEIKELKSQIDWEARGPKELITKYYRLKGKAERNSCNYGTQGTSAIINKVAGVYLWRWLIEKNYLFKVWFPNVIHDQNLLECPKELGEEVKNIIEKCMVDAGDKFCSIVPLTCTAEIKTKWTK